MMFAKENRKKGLSKPQCLSYDLDDYKWKIEAEISKREKKVDFAIWKLKRMKIMEIVVKSVAFMWAILWSIICIRCLLSADYKIFALFTAIPAIGFWVLLARAAGSIGLIDTEIEELRKAVQEQKEEM